MPAKRPSWRRRIVILLFVVSLFGAVGLWILLSESPAWYQPPAPDDVEVAQLADRVEFRLVEEVQRVRDEAAPWTLRLREHQVNAWLGSRLARWIENREAGWPETLGPPQVRFVEGAVDIAVEVRHGDRSQILSARLRPLIDGADLRVELVRVAVGQLPLPGEPLAALLEFLSDSAQLRSQLEAVDTWVGRLRDETFDARMELADGRIVRLTALELQPGWLDVTCKTRRGEAGDGTGSGEG